MKEHILDLCKKSKKWQVYYNHKKAYRTSNMCDRLMRKMSKFIRNNRYFHSSHAEATKLMRAFALVHNFAPYSPFTQKKLGVQSPFERLNGKKYSDNWLTNLMLASSLGGYRKRE